MRKLSELYSRNIPELLIIQSSGCASGVDYFRNFYKIKKSELLNSKVYSKVQKIHLKQFSNIPENFRMVSTRESGCASGTDHFRT